MSQSHVSWKSRWTFILAATGSAVGLGNIWKFPYITGEYGGGAFVLFYLFCIVLIGLPVMMAEILMGRAGNSDPVHSVLKLAEENKRSKTWSIVGIAGVCAGLMILMFYSVVAGWVMEYMYQSASGAYSGATAEQVGANFKGLTDSFGRQLMWHSIFLLFTLAVVAGGVTKGIGKTVEVLMPILFLFLLVLLGYSFAKGDVAAAANFMWQVDFSKLNQDAMLTAMGHAFFTLSLGMGSIMAYGSYMPKDASISKTAFTVAALDTLIAIIAGMAIFPIVFANGLEPGAGPGLMFVSLPAAFGQMPGGALFGGIFFTLVGIAALSSAISLIEPGIAWMEKSGIHRLAATGALGVLVWLGGLASIHSGEIFDLLDNITAKIMLPLGGILIAVFVSWLMKQDTVRQQVDISDGLYTVWLWLLRLVAPIAVSIVLIAGLVEWLGK